MDLISIPGGTFLMGSPPDEQDREDAEEPRRQVRLQPFFMGKFEVTQAQWQAVMGYNPSNFKGDNLPVESVTWYEAMEFCERLSERTGRIYRLPSEAEWEYACRAGTTTPFHFGETITPALANYSGSQLYGTLKGIFHQKTTPVGSYGVANGFGLYDMHGNVLEWCLDWFHKKYEGAPTDGSAWERPPGDARIVRGGSWIRNGGFCRSADRGRYAPDGKLSTYGFRVVAVF
jgi:formylglycine-generating enzyme required for sulfatase activity